MEGCLNIYPHNMEAMKNVDVRTVDPATLIDIGDVVIRKDLPKNERIADFVRQIKNPYCYKHGKSIVKIRFSDTEETIEDQLENYLASL